MPAESDQLGIFGNFYQKTTFFKVNLRLEGRLLIKTNFITATADFPLIFKYLFSFSIAIWDNVKPVLPKKECQKPNLVIFNISDSLEGF